MINLKKIYKKVCSARRGSSLYMVVVITAASALLLTAVTTSVVSASAVSRQNVDANQAYFTARSAVDAVVSQLQSTTNTSLANYVALNLSTDGSTKTSSPGTMTGGSTYTVTLTRIDSNTLQVTGTGTYRNVTRSATAKMNNVYLGAFQYLSYNTGDVVSFVDKKNVIFQGNIYSETNTKFNSVSQVSGIQGITNMQALTLDGNCPISGNIISGSGVTVSGANSITGNVQCNGDFTISTGSNCVVGGSVDALNNVNLQGSAATQINGNCSCNTATINPTYIPRLNNSTVYPYAPFPLSDTCSYYTPVPLTPVSSLGKVIVKNGVVIDGAVYNNVIDSSGAVTTSNPISTSNTDYIINTYGGDVYLFFDSLNDYKLSNVQFDIMGDHHLYIYLNNTNLSFDSKCYIGMQNKSDDIKAYIFGQNNGAINLNSNIKACVYAPDIAVSLADGTQFTGCLITKQTNLNSNCAVYYAVPDVTGTPLQAIVENAKKHDTSATTWTFLGWSGT